MCRVEKRKMIQSIVVLVAAAALCFSMIHSAELIVNSNSQEVTTETGEIVLVDNDRYIYFKKDEGRDVASDCFDYYIEAC